MRIWLDVDGVLCDLAGAVVNQYNQKHGTNKRIEDIQNWNWSPAMESHEAYDIFTHPKFWCGHCRTYPKSTKFADAICAIGKTIIATNHHGHGMTDKAMWIDAQQYRYSFAISPCKQMLFSPGDIVIDDSPDILNYAKKIGAHPICINRPWNQPTSSPAWTGERYDYEGALVAIKAITEAGK